MHHAGQGREIGRPQPALEARGAKDTTVQLVGATVGGPIEVGNGDRIESHQNASRFLERSRWFRVRVQSRAYVETRNFRENESQRAMLAKQGLGHTVEVLDLIYTVGKGPIARDFVRDLIASTVPLTHEPTEGREGLFDKADALNLANSRQPRTQLDSGKDRD